MSQLLFQIGSYFDGTMILISRTLKEYRMGQTLSQFKRCSWCQGGEIVSEGSLLAVQEVVVALRRNAHVLGHGWLFRVTGPPVHHEVVNEIVAAIEKGSFHSVRAMLEAGWRLEAAQALYVFLTRLDVPLIPRNIQSLVLDENNRNISPEVVATDVLGLIKENLPGRHLRLISLLLYLLDCSIKFSPADELRGNTLPIAMLPLFFNIQNQQLQEWRRIVTIFVEFIRQAGNHLEMPSVVHNRTDSLGFTSIICRFLHTIKTNITYRNIATVSMISL